MLGIISALVVVAALSFGSAWAITSQGRKADQDALLTQRQELERVLARVDMLEQKMRRLELSPAEQPSPGRPLARAAHQGPPPAMGQALGVGPVQRAQGALPSAWVVLDPLDPEAAPQVLLTVTSPALGGATSTSTIWRSLPASKATAARLFMGALREVGEGLRPFRVRGVMWLILSMSG